MRSCARLCVIRLGTLLLGLGLLGGCGALHPLERGVQDGVVVSSANPPLSISSNLPVLAPFHGTPQIETTNGMQSCEIWGAVYGSTADAPMAIAALAITPANWLWDLPPLMVVGPAVTEITLGGRAFAAQTLVVPVARDPFAALVSASSSPSQAMMPRQWLTRRLTTLDAFRSSKIILEYRELLADGQGMPGLPGQAELDSFANRAKNAFTVAFEAPAAFTAPQLWLGQVQTQYISRFVGPMQPNNFFKAVD